MIGSHASLLVLCAAILLLCLPLRFAVRTRRAIAVVALAALVSCAVIATLRDAYPQPEPAAHQSR